jgi:hypothetical protein
MKFDVHAGAPVDSAAAPRFLRLPPEGKEDPIFGCPRSKYLQLERDGVLHLIRLVPKGKRRGIVLVPVDQMWAHLEALHRDH